MVLGEHVTTCRTPPDTTLNDGDLHDLQGSTIVGMTSQGSVVHSAQDYTDQMTGGGGTGGGTSVPGSMGEDTGSIHNTNTSGMNDDVVYHGAGTGTGVDSSGLSGASGGDVHMPANTIEPKEADLLKLAARTVSRMRDGERDVSSVLCTSGYYLFFCDEGQLFFNHLKIAGDLVLYYFLLLADFRC